MITVARIETGDSKITIDEVKSYIHLIGNERDDELQVMLDAAIAAVEDYCNISLRPTTWKLSQDLATDNQKLFYPPVIEVVSINDYDGLQLQYKVLQDIVYIDTASSFICTYKTGEAEDANRYKAAVLAYTGLLFDGNDDNNSFNIVMSRYLPYRML